MDGCVSIRLLGMPEVEKFGEPFRGLESRKALVLLSYLIVQGHPIARSRLVDMFWRDKSEQRGRGNLSRVLNNLTGLLPDSFQADRNSIHYKDTDQVWVDLHAWESLVLSDKPDMLLEASRLSRGEFLEGVYLDDCPEVETWITTERELWKQRFIAITRTLTEYHAQRGDYDLALESATRLVDLDPWSEEAHRWRMLYLARTGRIAAALKHFSVCKAVLNNELSIGPSAETEKLRDRIIHAVARPILPVGTLKENFSLIDRKGDMNNLRRLFSRTDCRLVTITGTGGVGKSRLASSLVQQYPFDFLDGSVVVQLDTVASGSYLLAAVAQAFRLSDPVEGVTLQKLADWIGDREMILLFDNCDLLVSGESGDAQLIVWRLLEKTHHLKILATSRERLGLQIEWVYPLKGLLAQPENPHDDPREAPAFRLFEQHARRLNLDFEITQSDVPYVIDICRDLEGLPLGIELAAALTADLSCQQLAEAIRRDRDILASRFPDAPQRHRSLRVVFDHSWMMLDAIEKNALATLSVFTGHFDGRAASDLLGAVIPPGDFHRSDRLIRSLRDKSLLQEDSGHYSLHPTLQQYAREKLNEQNDRWANVLDAHARYYLERLLAVRDSLCAEEKDQAVECVRQDIDNLRAGWNRAVELGWWEIITPAEEPLFQFYYYRGWFLEGAEIFRAALRRLAGEPAWMEGLEPDRQLLAARLMLRQGIFLQRLADPGTAEILQSSLDVFRMVGDQAGIEMVLQYLELERK